MKFVKVAIIFVVTLVVWGAVALISNFTNKSIFDTTYSFEYAIITMPNGDIIEGRVSKWTDFDDGDQIQLTIDGKTYLTHISNVVMISE